MPWDLESAYSLLKTQRYKVFLPTLGKIVEQTFNALNSPESLLLREAGGFPAHVDISLDLADEIGDVEYELLAGSDDFMNSSRTKRLLKQIGDNPFNFMGEGKTTSDIANDLMQETYASFVKVVVTGVCCFDDTSRIYEKYAWEDSSGSISVDRAIPQFTKFIRTTLPDIPKDEVWDSAIVLCFLASILGESVCKNRSEDVKYDTTGIAYENECKLILENAGFYVRTTPTSGDFGADLIAEKDGLTYTIQVKGGSSPSGTKAVQETIAARSHYAADYCVVVSHSGFTPGAIEMAAKCGVVLVGQNGLKAIDALSKDLHAAPRA